MKKFIIISLFIVSSWGTTIQEKAYFDCLKARAFANRCLDSSLQLVQAYQVGAINKQDYDKSIANLDKILNCKESIKKYMKCAPIYGTY